MENKTWQEKCKINLRMIEKESEDKHIQITAKWSCDYIEQLEDKVTRRNIQIADLKQQIEKYQEEEKNRLRGVNDFNA